MVTIRENASTSIPPDRGARLSRVVVVGAGAAGTMAAIFAAAGGADTVLLERTRDGGRKILISGGGRCNVLPARLDESRFVTDSSPNTLRLMLRAWPLAEQIAYFEQEVGIPLAEETESAKLFPRSNRARDVRDGLLALAARRGARVRFDAAVTGIARAGNGWKVSCASGEPFDADRVIVATGGLSVPQTGSDGAGLAMLRALGHTVHPTYAALTPLLASPAPFGHLSGVSLTVTITAEGGGRKARATGGFLFTHRGYSGPAVLDVSHVAVRTHDDGAEPARILVQWSPLGSDDWERALAPARSRTVAAVVRDELPERLADTLLQRAEVPEGRTLDQLRREERSRLLQLLVQCELPWTGHEGYKKAEVTGGGVSLAEVDPRTMESKKQKGLFLCGEALDALGPIGGYNFYWAWATGRSAGRAAAG